MTFNLQKFRASLNRDGVLPNNRFEVDIEKAKDELLKIRCSSVTLPTVNLVSTNNPRLGIGPNQDIPHNVTFTQPSLSFILDGHGKIQKFFYDWINEIYSFSEKGFETGYRDSYSSLLTVKIFDYQEKLASTCTMYNAYPSNKDNLSYSWDSKNGVQNLSVPFFITHFKMDYQ